MVCWEEAKDPKLKDLIEYRIPCKRQHVQIDSANLFSCRAYPYHLASFYSTKKSVKVVLK